MTERDEYTRYTIRIPTELYDRLQEASGHKSLNAEITLRLEASFAEDKGTELEAIAEALAKHKLKLRDHDRLIKILYDKVSGLEDVTKDD
ncbi:putative DNA-binding protein [Labrenzia sp. EL_126]|nr:putative DNA-binding protein [Labrenzia sp. EL_126]